MTYLWYVESFQILCRKMCKTWMLVKLYILCTVCINIQCICINAKIWHQHMNFAQFLTQTSSENNNSCDYYTQLHTHTRLTALCPGLPRWAGTRKVKPIWILLKQETVSGCGISWAVCKSAPRSRQITTPTPHHSVFTGRMPFLPPNQQRQSTEGKNTTSSAFKLFTIIICTSTCILTATVSHSIKYAINISMGLEKCRIILEELY